MHRRVRVSASTIPCLRDMLCLVRSVFNYKRFTLDLSHSRYTAGFEFEAVVRTIEANVDGRAITENTEKLTYVASLVLGFAASNS